MDVRDDRYWKDKLTPERYRILRDGATEPPFTGKYVNHHGTGTYQCGACGQALFSSEAKFDSRSGWPSFDDPVSQERVELREDKSFGMRRTEVLCRRCGSHLGHLFDDGPTPSGQRYCINSAALTFKPTETSRP